MTKPQTDPNCPDRRIDPLLIEHGFWEISGVPAPLAGMPYPTTEKIRLIPFPRYQGIFCLADDETGYDSAPLRQLGSVYLEDLSSGGNPVDRVGEGMLTIRVIREIVSEINGGRGVVVHCWGGRGRSGFIAAGVLVAFGRTPEKARSIVNKATTKAGLGPWPESDWQFKFLSHLQNVELGIPKEVQ